MVITTNGLVAECVAWQIVWLGSGDGLGDGDCGGVDGDGLGDGGRRGAKVRRIGRARPELDDPVAQHAVRDLQVVVQVVEDPGALFEAKEAVIGLVSLLDLVSHLAKAPGAFLLEGRSRLDPLARIAGDLVATLIRSFRIEHQHEFIFRGCLGQNGRGG